MRHEKSRVPGRQNYEPGCMWGFLHLLDFHQGLHIKKMLMYRRHRDRPGGRSKIPKIEQDTPSGEEHICTEKDAALQIESRLDTKNRSSGKVRMKNLLLKRRSRDQEQMRKISPLASRLLRTISIHHMQSNDYVLPDELEAVSEISAVEVYSNETDTSSSSEHVHLWPKSSEGSILQKRCSECGTTDSAGNIICSQLDEQGNHLLEKQSLVSEKLTEAKMALLKQKVQGAKDQGDVALYQSKEFIGMMQLLSANRELLLKILQDPSFVLANNAQQASGAVLTKSGSFPVAGIPSRKNEEIFRLKQKKKQSESFINQDVKLEAEQVEKSTLVSEVGIIKSETATIDGAGTSTSSESLPVSRKPRHNGAISKRFKLIKQRIKDVIKENRREHRHISMDGILHKIPYGHKMSKNATKDIQSNKAISSGRKNSDKSMRRSHSLIDSLDKYSQLLDSISSDKSKKMPEISKEGDRLQAWESSKPLKRMFSLPELESFSLSKDNGCEEPNEILTHEVPATGVDVGNAAADIHGSDEPKVAGTLVDIEESIELDKALEQTVQIDDGEQTVLTEEYGQIETCSIQQDLETDKISDISQHEQEVMEETDGETILECIHSEEHASLTAPESQLSGDVPDVVEGTAAGLDRLQTTMEFTGIKSVHVPVDAKDEADFNYVRDILWKSGFSSEEFLGTWYSPYQPMDPLLFEEAENSPHENNSTGYEADMSLDHQLLFDLINEVLLDIYDTCFAYCPWLLRFDSRVRPMPVGYHVLEEVWANISWYLSQAQLDPATECVVARDFVKPDGWMNLQADSEEIAFELEDLILDDLVDEIVLELGIF